MLEGAKFITFLNKAGVTLSCRGSKKIFAPDTWESLEFNLDVGSIKVIVPIPAKISFSV
jgi:hypothetical protein